MTLRGRDEDSSNPGLTRLTASEEATNLPTRRPSRDVGRVLLHAARETARDPLRPIRVDTVFRHYGDQFGLTQWFEKMESVFSISNCTTTSQVKFASCTLQDNALTWWNSHVKTTTPEAAHAMPWATLKKMMTDKYYARVKENKYDELSKNNQNNNRRKRGRTQAMRTTAEIEQEIIRRLNLVFQSVLNNHEGVLVHLCANNCKRVGHLTNRL
ncbi:putative reverse transcriptase domain-containing protein [Tanacetum coccineum]|uniref:Reverse transcriptase domain-containing protein n=1 Tax=Tanacetum coccineum TaxID=301880 RepID=A0ABQ5BZ00_9ASTR